MVCWECVFCPCRFRRYDGVIALLTGHEFSDAVKRQLLGTDASAGGGQFDAVLVKGSPGPGGFLATLKLVGEAASRR